MERRWVVLFKVFWFGNELGFGGDIERDGSVKWIFPEAQSMNLSMCNLRRYEISVFLFILHITEEH